MCIVALCSDAREIKGTKTRHQYRSLGAPLMVYIHVLRKFYSYTRESSGTISRPATMVAAH